MYAICRKLIKHPMYELKDEKHAQTICVYESKKIAFKIAYKKLMCQLFNYKTKLNV